MPWQIDRASIPALVENQWRTMSRAIKRTAWWDDHDSDTIRVRVTLRGWTWCFCGLYHWMLKRKLARAIVPLRLGIAIEVCVFFRRAF